MTMPISVKKKDGGRIAGPASVANVIEIKWQVNLPNTKATFNVAHGSFTTAPTSMQALANSLFTAISSAWGTNFGLLMAAGPPATTFANLYIRDMTSFANPVFTAAATAVLGTSASPAMPVNVAAVLTENIATRGKGMKGRIFLGGWATNADAGGGVMSGTVVSAINAFGIALANAITAQSLVPCVAQVARAQYQGVTGTVHPARGTPGIGGHVAVTTYTSRNNLWETQRRRGQL